MITKGQFPIPLFLLDQSYYVPESEKAHKWLRVDIKNKSSRHELILTK